MTRPRHARKLIALGLIVLSTAVAGATPAMATNLVSGSPDSATSTQAHLDAATKNTFGDEHLIETYRKYSCFEVEDPSIRDEYRAGSATRKPLTKILDGLWYIGDGYVGQYILTTKSGGFALIDTLNSSSDFETYTLPALKSLGLSDSKPLEGVFISHGHWDHDGGAQAIRSHFRENLPIHLGSGDTQGKTYSPTPVDTSTSTTKELTIGGTKIYAQPTPGHTEGNLVGFIPVEHEGTRQLLLINGRSGVPQDVTEALKYLRGTELQYEAARKLGATGTIHTHPLSDGSMRQIDSINSNGAGHPDFLLGKERTLRAAAIWRECAAARIAELDPSIKIPVWRATSIDFESRRPLTHKLSAEISTPWGPVVNAPMNFQIGNEEICSATTDNKGTASCTSSNPLRPRQIVTAVFDGSQASTYINLPSNSVRSVIQR